VEPWLADAMAALTARQRTAVTLRFVNDLDPAGIAREMEHSVGTEESSSASAAGPRRVS
jgi:DNA-directed RNA polymerase specialized sigma24 family protein